MERLIDALKKENPGVAGGAASAGGGHGDGGGNAEERRWHLLSTSRSKCSSSARRATRQAFSRYSGPRSTLRRPCQQRKAYLQLSRMIHPDKLSRHFDGATRAFQELVRAFDDLTKPPAPTDEGVSGKNKQTTISRSNDGCFKTKIFCPRCDAEWFMPDSGGPPTYRTREHDPSSCPLASSHGLCVTSPRRLLLLLTQDCKTTITI